MARPLRLGFAGALYYVAARVDGQEDIYPVAQFEKLWGDMTTLPDVPCGFIATDMRRGRQLKSQDQLDAWHRDGTAAYIDSLCSWR